MEGKTYETKNKQIGQETKQTTKQDEIYHFKALNPTRNCVIIYTRLAVVVGMEAKYGYKDNRGYEHLTELTPEIMHELIEKIVVHAPEKVDKHRTQQIDIYYRFGIAMATAVADNMVYDKKRKVA